MYITRNSGSCCFVGIYRTPFCFLTTVRNAQRNAVKDGFLEVLDWGQCSVPSLLLCKCRSQLTIMKIALPEFGWTVGDQARGSGFSQILWSDAFQLFNVTNSHRIALCVLYPFLQLLLYLMFQGKELERFVFVFFLRATELRISSAKRTFLLFLSFSRYCSRSFLTIMAGVGVANKLLKKNKKKINIQIFDKLNY